MNDLDILLVQPPQGLIERFSKPMENLGLGFISSYLSKSGVTCDIYYPSFEDSGRHNILEQYLNRRPLIIGISVVTYYYHNDIVKFTFLLRAMGYSGKIVIGGHSASFFPEEILKRDPNVDIVVIGQGEEPLNQLIGALKDSKPERVLHVPSIVYRSGQKIKKNPVYKDLKIMSVPKPDRKYVGYMDDEFKRRLLFSVSMSRGCYGKCRFCSINQFYNKFSSLSWSSREVNSVVSEIGDLARKGVNYFTFVDDEFFGNKPCKMDRIKTFCKLLRETKVDVNFSICCRVDSVDRTSLLMLREVGLRHVFLGVEFFNDRELDLYKKQTTIQKNIDAVKTIKDLGLSLQCGFIMFHPFATLKDIRTNLEVLRSLDEAKPFNFSTVLEPYYGTEIRSLLEQEGLLKMDGQIPSIIFKDEKVDMLYRFTKDLMDKYVPFARAYSRLTDSLSFEWIPPPKQDSFYSVKKNEVDGCIGEINKIWSAVFLRMLDHLMNNKKGDATSARHEFNRLAHEHLNALDSSTSKIKIKLEILNRMKEELHEKSSG